MMLKFIVILALAPAVSGLITKIKNNLRMRKGPGVLQPYFDIMKLFAKEEVISKDSSIIFRIAPFIVFASAAVAALIVPSIVPINSISYIGDILAVFFILALGRFFMALAGLDAGSAFGGMGSSRDMFVSSFAEPAAFLAVFAVALSRGNTALITSNGTVNLSTVIAAAALLTVIIAETSRIPVDNQETHLELTMIHEAMTLEYSGRSLAFIELGSYLKQFVLFSLLAGILVSETFLFFGAILIIALVISLIEISVAKMRLFRTVDFLSFGLVLSILAVIAAAVGV